MASGKWRPWRRAPFATASCKAARARRISPVTAAASFSARQNGASPARKQFRRRNSRQTITRPPGRPGKAGRSRRRQTSKGASPQKPPAQKSRRHATRRRPATRLAACMGLPIPVVHIPGGASHFFMGRATSPLASARVPGHIAAIGGGDAADGSGCSSGVEHNLAKVGVEGSNPFARSKYGQQTSRREAAFLRLATMFQGVFLRGSPWRFPQRPWLFSWGGRGLDRQRGKIRQAYCAREKSGADSAHRRRRRC